MQPDDPSLNDPKWLADHASYHRFGAIPQWFVPGVTWVKDFPGQVTNGRIGRPSVENIPLSWLPSAIGDKVLEILEAKSE